MYVKRLRRRCGVRGCKNMLTYTISHRKESGNSVIICRKCITDAAKEIDKYEKETPKIFRTSSDTVDLFYHPELTKTTEKILLGNNESDIKQNGAAKDKIKENLSVTAQNDNIDSHAGNGGSSGNIVDKESKDDETYNFVKAENGAADNKRKNKPSAKK